MAPKDQRTKSAYIFGAICPERGVGAALVLPRCDTQAMQWHLNEIASQVASGAHAVIMMDQAGWHTTDKLAVPANITILPLPPRSPELNPVENIWQFIRDNWLSNRVFESYDQIIALCCHAWNKCIKRGNINQLISALFCRVLFPVLSGINEKPPGFWLGGLVFLLERVVRSNCVVYSVVRLEDLAVTYSPAS